MYPMEKILMLNFIQKNMYKYLLLFAFILNWGCTNTNSKIGFILPNLNNRRYIVERDYVIEKCKHKKIEVLFAHSNNDEQKQIEQFNEMLKQGVKVIILDPVNRYTAAIMVRKAHEAGVKVISYDRLIVGSTPDAYISFDAIKIGESMADYVLKIKPEGKYILLNGDKSDINAVWLKEGLMNKLQPAINTQKVQLNFTLFIDSWNEQEAAHSLDKYIRYSAMLPDVIISTSDLMSRGCIKVLKNLGIQPHQIIVTGQNAEPYACKSIREGYQTITIYKPVRKLADLAIEVSLRFLKNQSVNDILTNKIDNGHSLIPSQLLDGIVIDSSNLNILINDKYLLAEEIN